MNLKMILLVIMSSISNIYENDNKRMKKEVATVFANDTPSFPVSIQISKGYV